MLHYHEIENDSCLMELEIEFNYRPGARTYCVNGMWIPGWWPEVDITAVRVKRIETDWGVLERADFLEVEIIDAMAWTSHLEDDVYDDLIETAIHWREE